MTVTLHTTGAFDPLQMRGWYDTGGWVNVQLSEPLGGRMLFDGSQLLPVPRS